MTFSEHLSKLRAEKKLTQKGVATEVGISWRAYQNYERGVQEPTLSTLIALADFYQISLDELVCREQK
ncbi:MAG: helix-turn-helix transcriptional regulator [Ruminococcaceae bacterium]|nr:helix-turn-helix transcriptional regulator [Oscillospiraceae bacterium]